MFSAVEGAEDSIDAGKQDASVLTDKDVCVVISASGNPKYLLGVLEKADELEARIKNVCRVKTDKSDQSPGWKFSEYEMKGVPLRLEIGPKDIENNQCVIVRRDNREKYFVSLDELETKIPELLAEVHKGLYEKALANRENRTYACNTIDEIKSVLAEKGDGFI